MGSLDRPGEPPDVPDEAAPAKRMPGPESGPWLNLDNESEENLRAFLGLDRDGRLPDLAEAVEVPEFSVLAKDWDVVPGVEPPDYRNPDAKDSLRLERGQDVIVGRHGSEDNPRRVAEVQDDGRLLDKPDEPEPDLLSGEELVEIIEDDDKSRLAQARDMALKPATIEATKDLGEHYGPKVRLMLEDPPGPPRCIVGTPDRQVATEQQVPSGFEGLGSLVVVPILALAVGKTIARSDQPRPSESTQLKGDRDDAGG
jgi:hypothetical protein